MKWIEERLRQIGRKKIELAAHLNTTPQRVSDILNGSRKITAGEVLPLSDCLRMNIEAVVTLCHQYEMEKKRKKLVKVNRDCSPKT